MITSAEMRELEANSGVPLSILMKRAGTAVYEALKQKFDLKGKKTLIVCYHGNNGGDGFVAANLLSNDTEVDVLFIGDEEKMKKEASANYKRLLNNPGVQFVSYESIDFDDYDIIIDAILGIGYKGRLNKEILNVIDDINKSKPFKISVNIPTGLNPDTGEVLEKSVTVDLIVTFHEMKPGLEAIKEKVVIADIGL